MAPPDEYPDIAVTVMVRVLEFGKSVVSAGTLHAHIVNLNFSCVADRRTRSCAGADNGHFANFSRLNQMLWMVAKRLCRTRADMLVRLQRAGSHGLSLAIYSHGNSPRCTDNRDIVRSEIPGYIDVFWNSPGSPS